MVSALALYPADPGSTPAPDYYLFTIYCIWVKEKTKINEKEAGNGPLKNIFSLP